MGFYLQRLSWDAKTKVKSFDKKWLVLHPVLMPEKIFYYEMVVLF